MSVNFQVFIKILKVSMKSLYKMQVPTKKPEVYMVKLYLKKNQKQNTNTNCSHKGNAGCHEDCAFPGVTYTGSSPVSQHAWLCQSPLHTTGREPQVSGR